MCSIPKCSDLSIWDYHIDLESPDPSNYCTKYIWPWRPSVCVNIFGERCTINPSWGALRTRLDLGPVADVGNTTPIFMPKQESNVIPVYAYQCHNNATPTFYASIYRCHNLQTIVTWCKLCLLLECLSFGINCGSKPYVEEKMYPAMSQFQEAQRLLVPLLILMILTLPLNPCTFANFNMTMRMVLRGLFMTTYTRSQWQ